MELMHDIYRKHSLKSFWDWWSRCDTSVIADNAGITSVKDGVNITDNAGITSVKDGVNITDNAGITSVKDGVNITGNDIICNDVTVMEIRILKGIINPDYEQLKNFANKNGLKLIGGSFFVSSYEQLLCIVKNPVFRNNYNIYYSLNPRKKCYKIYNGKTYADYGGKNVNVKYIRFVPFDIESLSRSNIATDDELLNSIKFADYIIKHLYDKFQWKDYVKICSGNGVHLIYRLDKDIELPELEYKINTELQKIIYIETREFKGLKTCVNKLLKDSDKKLNGMFNCKFDNTGDLARVLRLPLSKNNKPEYTEKRYCGILSIGLNDAGCLNKGMTKSLHGRAKIIIDMLEVKKYKKNNNIKIDLQHQYTKDTIKYCPLAKLLLIKQESGNRNHYLEMQFALLLKENGILPDDIPELISEINGVQGKGIQVSADYLPDDARFNPEIVNRWCVMNLIKPTYIPLYADKPEIIDIGDVAWIDGEYDNDNIKWDKDDIFNSLRQIVNEINGMNSNILMGIRINEYVRFLNKNYGIKMSKYLCKHDIIKRLVNIGNM